MQRRTGSVGAITPEIKLLLTIDEVAGLLSVGRSTVYDLMWQGELRGVKIGTARRIVAASLREYITRMLDC